MRQVSERVIARDRVCACCGQAPTPRDPLTVHHSIPRRVAPELALDESNLAAYLRSHHGRAEALTRRRLKREGKRWAKRRGPPPPDAPTGRSRFLDTVI